jgi:hypothetical protein
MPDAAIRAIGQMVEREDRGNRLAAAVCSRNWLRVNPPQSSSKAYKKVRPSATRSEPISVRAGDTFLAVPRAKGSCVPPRLPWTPGTR